MKWIWLTFALLLTGCAGQERPLTSPVRYASYRESMVDYLIRVAKPGIPHPVVIAYAVCATEYVIANTTPADLARLDAYARQEAQISPVEGHAIEARQLASTGGVLTTDNLDRLNGICPGDVPAFKRWLKA